RKISSSSRFEQCASTGNKPLTTGVFAPVGAQRAGADSVWMSPREMEQMLKSMLDMSRRDFVVSTGMAAPLGLSGRLAVSPAFAQKTPDPAKPFVTYKVGSAEVTAIYDGIWEKAHDPAFIANASVDDVKSAMTKAGLPADFVSIPFTVCVVKTGGKTILCDSGTGGDVQTTAGQILAHLQAAGL